MFVGFLVSADRSRWLSFRSAEVLDLSGWPDPTPLHDQVAAQIRRAIADGEASPGERLPPARDIAAVLEVNTNTVLQALRQLRLEGLLEFRRGLGVRVAGSPERSHLTAKALELLALARHHGYQRDELIEIIQRLG